MKFNGDVFPFWEGVFFRSKLFVKFAWPTLLFKVLFSDNWKLWNLEFIV